MRLPARIDRATRGARHRLGVRDAVAHGDLLLPPPALRPAGSHFQDDTAFLDAARRDVGKLREAFGVTTDTRLLDIGSGVGRLAIGLLDQVGEMRAYDGVDVAERSVRWCRRHITRHHPGMRFTHLPVANARYQPDGTPIGEGFALPFEARSADVVFLYSVFSHMTAADVRIYLEEIRRVLVPGGGVFLTAFVEDGVEDVAVNPPGYGPIPWEGALHCVRFGRPYFEGMVRAAGLGVDRVEHGTETDGQSAFYLRPAAV